jgi:uracil-DNA glycosylase
MKFNLEHQYVHYTWEPMFQQLYKDKERTKIIEKQIKKEMKFLYPSSENIFRAFQKTSFRNLKVVFIGQDPYPGVETINNISMCQACGLAFSVQPGFKKPKSLINIFKNLKNFNHITDIPKSGCLDLWAYQGCLMLNAALTLGDNSHLDLWKSMTDDIIKWISDNSKFCVFVLWGAFAVKKLQLIDSKKHAVIISSHPSGLSCNKKLGNYPAFNGHDHFGMINKHLKKNNINTINW